MSQFGTEIPLLDARLFGHDTVYTATKNTTTDFYYTFPYGCKFNGIEIITDGNVVLGDGITLSTEYNAGPYGWKRYKKFSDTWHVKKDDRTRIILFPTEPSAGVRVKISYKSLGTVDDVNFVVNFFTFVDQASVNPGALEEGEDW
jgi:hypothetical protein